MAGIVEGKVAVVTGGGGAIGGAISRLLGKEGAQGVGNGRVGTRGGGAIGGAISRLLAKEGAKVVVNDVGGTVFGSDQNDPGPAQKVVADIKTAGGQALINGDSVPSWEPPKKTTQCPRDTFGRIDLVVNNAGIIRMASFHKLMPKDW